MGLAPHFVAHDIWLTKNVGFIALRITNKRELLWHNRLLNWLVFRLNELWILIHHLLLLINIVRKLMMLLALVEALMLDLAHVCCEALIRI